MRVLLVEDTVALARSLGQGLEEEGYSVDLAYNGEDGLHLASEINYDAIVLDRMLPRLDGLTVLRRLRAAGRRTPVLLLTALGEVDERVGGLDAGADDYLVKPFAFAELLARLRALVRRDHGQASNRLELGRLVLDLGARSAQVDGRPLSLTARELSVLELLALNAGQTLTRTRIAERIYDEGSERDSNVIDVFIGRLRKKLEAVGLPGAELLKTQRGEGYRLDPSVIGGERP
ncbi:MAG: response regulator transcription factor [Deltaproteobacteria bacterium]|nr:response regulator transcription factor [Deltaproteobacteria bacterium]